MVDRARMNPPEPPSSTGDATPQRLALLGQLAGCVAHDLNNVFASIGGSVGMLELDPHGPLTPRHLHNIHRSMQRGAEIVRQLQYFNPRSDGPFEPLDAAQIIREVAESLQERFGASYEVAYACEPDLPACTADTSQVRHVLLQLGTNARDAMPQGGKITLIATHRVLDERAAGALGPEARPGDFIALSVRDHGSGMTPEVRQRLFEPFFTTKPKGKAMGLGLAGVLRLLHRHGGFVQVTTEAGRGSEVAAYFPVTRAEERV